MRRAIRFITGLSAIALAGTFISPPASAQVLNPSSGQPPTQVTRAQVGPLTQERLSQRKGAMDYQMNQARQRFPEVDMNVRSTDFDLRQQLSREPRFGDTDVDLRLREASGVRGPRGREANAISARAADNLPRAFPFGSQYLDGSFHWLVRDEWGIHEVTPIAAASLFDKQYQDGSFHWLVVDESGVHEVTPIAAPSLFDKRYRDGTLQWLMIDEWGIHEVTPTTPWTAAGQSPRTASARRVDPRYTRQPPQRRFRNRDEID